MTRDQERGLALLVCVGVLIGGAVLLWPRPRAETTSWARPIFVDGVTVVVPTLVEPQRIDVNRATAAELAELPGIGPALAARIVAYREANGPFRTLDELTKVKGIGPATVGEFRAAATVGLP